MPFKCNLRSSLFFSASILKALRKSGINLNAKNNFALHFHDKIKSDCLLEIVVELFQDFLKEICINYSKDVRMEKGTNVLINNASISYH
jgi:hypothetical protein